MPRRSMPKISRLRYFDDILLRTANENQKKKTDKASNVQPKISGTASPDETYPNMSNVAAIARRIRPFMASNNESLR